MREVVSLNGKLLTTRRALTATSGHVLSSTFANTNILRV